ncbi:MAG: type IV pilus assembly protein PilM [Lentisphaeria bacterium]|nr:type IV pilus assembly protein PilM [Lentisphaeria bacterium]
MASQDLMLCIDIGAGSIKAAEFSYSPEGDMLMESFAHVEYISADTVPAGTELNGNVSVLSDAKLDLLQALNSLLTEHTFRAKKVSISLSGHDSYIRFVKVPAMVQDEKKINQIVEYEAQSAVPFDLSEVVWGSQLLHNDNDNSEIEAMLVIVKGEEIEQITNILEASGKKVTLIEISPTACYNVARLSDVGSSQCELILNVGERSSSLIFVDNKRVFVRIIPIAGHAITAQISKEFGISFQEAEEMKRRHGFVALGGAYEEPESEVSSTVSKIVRNVMTRLHGEISRSINIYRSQQKGRKPEKLYLAGGSTVMGYTQDFFAEKLRIPVEYFNPLQNVAMNPQTVDKEKLSEVAHTFSEVIGLALRQVVVCPLEISLIPSSVKKQMEFRTKQPYFYAAAATLLLCLLVTYFGFSKQLSIASEKKNIAVETLNKVKGKVSRLRSAEGAYNSVKSEYDAASAILAGRTRWPRLLNEIQNVLPNDIWLTKFELSTVDPVARNAVASKKRDRTSDDLFGGIGQSNEPAAVSRDYVSVYMEGNGLVQGNDFSERFTRLLSQSQFFTFNIHTDVIDRMSNGTLLEGHVNIASFTLTLKMKEIFKQ